MSLMKDKQKIKNYVLGWLAFGFGWGFFPFGDFTNYFRSAISLMLVIVGLSFMFYGMDTYKKFLDKVKT